MLSRFFVPDTVDYLIAGYLVLTVVISSYILSIYFRLKKSCMKKHLSRLLLLDIHLLTLFQRLTSKREHHQINKWGLARTMFQICGKKQKDKDD